MKKLILLLLLVGCETPIEQNEYPQECNPDDFTSIALTDEMGNILGYEGNQDDASGWDFTPEFQILIDLINSSNASDIINQLDSLLTDSLSIDSNEKDSLIQNLEDSLIVIIPDLIIINPDEDDLFTAEGDFTIGEILVGNGYLIVDVAMPSELAIGKPYPNPFNLTTSIPLSINNSDSINVYVINDECDSIKTIVDSHISAGSHTITWDGTNDNNQIVNNGYYRIIASNAIFEVYQNVKKESND
tara:strand:- start:19 stop:753 length:735 start_codon:yes stop_codon:yes gene_type:complete